MDNNLAFKIVCENCHEEIVVVGDAVKDVVAVRKNDLMQYSIKLLKCNKCKTVHTVQIDNETTRKQFSRTMKLLTKTIMNRESLSKSKLTKLRKQHENMQKLLTSRRTALAINASGEQFTDVNTGEQFIYKFIAFNGGEDGNNV